MKGILEGGHVIVPKASLLVVGLADLPVLGGIVQPLLEAPELLVLADVQVELENMRIVLDKALFKVVDTVVALGPDFFGTRLCTRTTSTSS